MRKLYSSWLLLLLLAACSDSAPSPVIEITGLYVNDDEKDYAQELSLMPTLKVGDEVLVSLQLDGNGEELNSFIARDDNKQLTIKMPDLPKAGISDEPGLTKPDEGIFVFKNGVRQMELEIKAKVKAVKDEDAILVFYLSSRAECEADKAEVDMKTGN